MDQERLEKIELGQEYMNAELLTKIEKFRKFDENSRPIVTVLCSDNRLLTQMGKLTSGFNEVDFHVCGTFNGTEEALEKAYFSDAIIVNTLALKIAPEGLFNVLKSVEQLGKEVYFILSGWESIPKSAEQSRKRIVRIDDEFPFARIKASQNVFIKPLEGFSFIEDVMANYVRRISETFSFVHGVQVEAVYKELRREIKRFRELLCIEIQKEQALVLQLQQSFYSKQKRYAITFSHATVNINDALERFEKTVKRMDMDDALCCLESDYSSAKEKYAEDPNGAARQVKLHVYDKIADMMNDFTNSSTFDNTMSSQTGAKVDDAMNDLLSLANRLEKCRFIDSVRVSELNRMIRETDNLLSSASGYAGSVATILDRVKDSLRSKILGFQFEDIDGESKIDAVKDGIKKVAGFFINNDGSDGAYDPSDCSDETLPQIKEIEKTDSSKESCRDSQWETFCSEVQRLIEYSRNALSALISDNSRLINEEIDVQSRNTVNDYFGFIIEKLGSISEYLRKQLEDYGRSDI